MLRGDSKESESTPVKGNNSSREQKQQQGELQTQSTLQAQIKTSITTTEATAVTNRKLEQADRTSSNLFHYRLLSSLFTTLTLRTYGANVNGDMAVFVAGPYIDSVAVEKERDGKRLIAFHTTEGGKYIAFVIFADQKGTVAALLPFVIDLPLSDDFATGGTGMARIEQLSPITTTPIMVTRTKAAYFRDEQEGAERAYNDISSLLSEQTLEEKEAQTLAEMTLRKELSNQGTVVRSVIFGNPSNATCLMTIGKSTELEREGLNRIPLAPAIVDVSFQGTSEATETEGGYVLIDNAQMSSNNLNFVAEKKRPRGIEFNYDTEKSYQDENSIFGKKIARGCSCRLSMKSNKEKNDVPTVNRYSGGKSLAVPDEHSSLPPIFPRSPSKRPSSSKSTALTSHTTVASTPMGFPPEAVLVGRAIGATSNRGSLQTLVSKRTCVRQTPTITTNVPCEEQLDEKRSLNVLNEETIAQLFATGISPANSFRGQSLLPGTKRPATQTSNFLQREEERPMAPSAKHRTLQQHEPDVLIVQQGQQSSNNLDYSSSKSPTSRDGSSDTTRTPSSALSERNVSSEKRERTPSTVLDVIHF
jgi:hypothetical protein